MWISDAVLDHVQEVTDEPDLSATKYRLIRAIGRGGMGVVYLAEDTELEREVALKVSAASSRELAERLGREARILARLEHPGIVPVHDVGALPDGRIYSVMKLVRGEQLDAWARKNPDRRALLRLFQRICEAVAFAHAGGVIHRDLKPANVMVGAFGEALVMDWGIAKEIGEAAQVEAAGTVLGTSTYMAPEQARGDVAAVDERSDVYALGAILSFLLTNFPANPAPSRPLASICNKAMAPEQANRYTTPLALALDIGRFLDAEPVEAHPEGPLERAARFASRHRVVLSLLAAYLLVRVLLIALAR